MPEFQVGQILGTSCETWLVRNFRDQEPTDNFIGVGKDELMLVLQVDDTWVRVMTIKGSRIGWFEENDYFAIYVHTQAPT